MHLYAAFLGGPMSEGRMGEGHEVVMVVAEDAQEAKTRAKAKWTGKGRGHVDAVQRIDMVDGFEVSLALRGVGDRTEARQLQLMEDRNVLGGSLEPCSSDPLTGFYRDGCCTTGPEDLGNHTICAVVTAEFLEHQRTIGNDLVTPMPQFRFPGLVPGDRWCVTAVNWLRAHHDGAAAYVVLASTHERALEIVPLAALEEHAVDVPAGPGDLGG